jgi:hypothetical protein
VAVQAFLTEAAIEGFALRYCVEVLALEKKESNGGSSIELATRSAI